MQRLSFKEYYDTKERLRKAGVENIRAHIEYAVTKYCKIPVVEDLGSEKEYISLKPKDRVKILWEYESETPILKRLTIVLEDEKVYVPCWSSTKMFEWAGANCKQSRLNA